MSQPITSTVVENFRIRNFTNEKLNSDELSCLVSFLSSLDICKSCIRDIPRIQSSFGSDLDFSIDFENRTLDIKYMEKPVCGW
ncbi:MAG: hypothetical protein ACTSW1_14625 [Candidatus Hodarchaeales archaeon]